MVVDIGTNVMAEQFASAARERGASAACVSAPLTATFVGTKDVVTAIHAAGLEDIKVIIGGAPVTADFAAEIGADGYAQDAAAAVSVARSALGIA